MHMQTQRLTAHRGSNDDFPLRTLQLVPASHPKTATPGGTLCLVPKRQSGQSYSGCKIAEHELNSWLS